MTARFRFDGTDLDGEFEQPPRGSCYWSAGGPRPRWLRIAGDGGSVLAAVHEGVGVWDLHSGELRWWHRQGDAAVPLDDQSVLVAEYWAATTVPNDLLHRLARYAWPAMVLLDEAWYQTPDGGGAIEGLLRSPSGRLVAAVLNSGQGDNGYDVYTLEPSLRRLTNLAHDRNPQPHQPMYAPPAFSPDERWLACSAGFGYGMGAWWSPPYEQWPVDFVGDEYEIPSLGGPTTFGSLILHDIPADVAHVHRLEFDLPAGWVPDDVEDSRWSYGAIGVDFPAEDRVRLVLPDGVPVEIVLPVPEVVRLPTPARSLSPLS